MSAAATMVEAVIEPVVMVGGWERTYDGMTWKPVSKGAALDALSCYHNRPLQILEDLKSGALPEERTACAVYRWKPVKVETAAEIPL